MPNELGGLTTGAEACLLGRVFREVESLLKTGEELPKGFKGRDAQLPGIPDDRLVAEKNGVNPKTISRGKDQIRKKYGSAVFKKLGYK